MEVILEAEGWVVSVWHRNGPASADRVFWTSILKLQQPNSGVLAYKGVEGVLVGNMCIKKPESDIKSLKGGTHSGG